jgi:hypothetical protein
MTTANEIGGSFGGEDEQESNSPMLSPPYSGEYVRPTMKAVAFFESI